MVVGELVEKSAFKVEKTTHTAGKGPNSPGGPEDVYGCVGTWKHEMFLKIGTYIPGLGNYFMHSSLLKTTVVSHFDIRLKSQAAPVLGTRCKSIRISAKAIK